MGTNTDKIKQLEDFIGGLDKVIIGYSGGVDSTLVAYVSNKMLGKNALNILAKTETITEEDIELARSIAGSNQFNFREIEYSELEIENYAANPVNRCYFCKQELYRRLGEIAKKENIKVILDGANLDDIGDYRPGRTAAKEFNVLSPLIETKLTKQEVRDAAQFYGLPNHDKPAAPCLSSRIPYGTLIDRQSISMVAQAEKYIRNHGFRNVRVRHFQTTAKIEVDAEDVVKLFGIYDEIQAQLKTYGYKEILIDPEGFSSGKLNREIIKNEK